MTDHTEKDLKIPNGLDEYIKKSLEDQENANDFNNCWSLKSMFAVGNDEAIKILPTLDEFLSAMAADPEKELFVRKVCSNMQLLHIHTYYRYLFVHRIHQMLSPIFCN